MAGGATTPEELDALFEDAFVLGDALAVCELFEQGGVLAAGGGATARGDEAIASAAARHRAGGHTYISQPRRILQARAVALLVGTCGLHVAHRGADGAWRIAIALLETAEGREGGPHEQ